jgi:MarR family transcriptional regulator, organic hydroperoxide resistance regulator
MIKAMATSQSTSRPPAVEPTARAAAQPVSAALDIGEYVSGTAGEAWALMARLLFRHGKPRFPAIAHELDLHPGQAVALRLLDEPRPMGEMAEAMHCDNSNITGIVDRLEERGLVERRAAEHDRRVKLIALTSAGEQLREQLNLRMADPPEPLKRLSEKDQRALREILARALNAAEGT